MRTSSPDPLTHYCTLLIVSVTLLAGVLAPEGRAQDADMSRQEEKVDYYKKWLEEDVVYIISDDEKSVFQQLRTEEEREQFIEQFWFRRDPDPRSANNEFKEEHYRRIAYANERFASGVPGWVTDRGRIYIIHGPPHEIDSRPTGGTYSRPNHEGGGDTTTYPFEIWRYRHIEGVGEDVILEFVDRTLSNEYRLALNPEDKDALLHIPNAGLTRAEQLGLASKADRPYFSPGNRGRYPLMDLRARDNPFERYQRLVQVMSPQEIRYKDLKELVEVNVSYDNLPYLFGAFYYRLNEDQVLVPVTLQVEHRKLTFKPQDNGVHAARVAVYGIVTSITNRVVAEFEDDLRVTFADDQLQAGLLKSSVYQKTLALDRRMRYKLDLIVKDVQSGQIGVKKTALVPPRFSDEELSASSMIVSGSIRVLDEIPTGNPMFVLGDVKIHPDLSGTFRAGGRLGVYLQVYNAGIDQTTLAPSVGVSYRIVSGERKVAETIDESGESVQLASGQRLVLIKELPVTELPPGRYKVQVELRDRIRDEHLTLEEGFHLRQLQDVVGDSADQK